MVDCIKQSIEKNRIVKTVGLNIVRGLGLLYQYIGGCWLYYVCVVRVQHIPCMHASSTFQPQISRSRLPLAEQCGRSTSVTLVSSSSSRPVVLARTSLRIIHAHIVPITLFSYIPGSMIRVDDLHDDPGDPRFGKDYPLYKWTFDMEDICQSPCVAFSLVNMAN